MKKDKANSSEPNKNVDIKLCFGDNSQQKILIQTSMQFQYGVFSNELQDFMINHKNGQENDLFIMIKFEVSPGQQKDATQYLQKGMDETDLKQRISLNPIQHMLHRPKSAGRVYFQQNQGEVIVYYCIYNQYALRNQNFSQTLQILLQDKTHHPKINLNFFIRGQETKAVKDKTAIQPSYSQIQLALSGLQLPSIIKVFKQKQLLPPELINQFPLFDMITLGLKKIKLSGNFGAFRKLSSMYKQIAKIKEETEPDPYIHKNLLKNKFKVTFSWRKLGLLEGQVKFMMEDHLQRMAGFALKGFDWIKMKT